jgi:hypothetical protein
MTINVSVEQQHDDHQRQRDHDHQPLFGAFVVFVLAAPDGIEAGRKFHDCCNGRLGVGDVAAEIAVAGIDEDVGGQLRVLCSDRSWALHEFDLGHLAQWYRCAVWQGNQHLA